MYLTRSRTRFSSKLNPHTLILWCIILVTSRGIGRDKDCGKTVIAFIIGSGRLSTRPKISAHDDVSTTVVLVFALEADVLILSLDFCNYTYKNPFLSNIYIYFCTIVLFRAGSINILLKIVKHLTKKKLGKLFGIKCTRFSLHAILFVTY